MALEMLKKAGTFTSEYLGPLLKAGIIMIIGVPKEVESLKKERMYIPDLIRKAEDRVAAALEREREQMKRTATKLRIIAFRMEDVFDEWNSCLQHEKMNESINMEAVPQTSGCVTLTSENARFVRFKCYERLQIAFKIKSINSELVEIKADLPEIKENISSSSEQQDSNLNREEKKEKEKKEKEKRDEIARRNPDDKWKKLHRQPYKVKTKIVGFKDDSKRIIGWLDDQSKEECKVMVLVGMAGQGKTTLAKTIFYNKELIKDFKCSVWINVSDFDDPVEFYRLMLEKFYNKKKSPPQGYLTMDLVSLEKEVKKYLCSNSYCLFFDDVWSINFWDEIKQTVSSNDIDGCRIIITTRNKEVAYSCDKSRTTVVEVQPLSIKESMTMFCRIAFEDDEKSCPEEYEEISSEIVEICEGLPLGIEAIGKLVSNPEKNPYEWKSELGESDKGNITKRLCLSYDNLPENLKPCLLYFGIYPQGYAVKTKRLIRQWIAEGFATYDSEKKKSAEKVAEDNLKSLINRNLVLVSSFTIDHKPKSCRIHYLVHDMILRKFEDLYFCRCINEDNRADVCGVTRRLSITTNSTEELPGLFGRLLDKIESLYIRSLHFFTKEELPELFASQIPSKYKQLKVLDFENSRLWYNLEQDLGELIHLKYLSFRNTKIRCIPKSIGMLQNLETLDVRQTDVNEMPEEVAKLINLRHFLGLVQMKVGMGGMISLQTLRSVELDDNVGLIENELGKLWQITDLGLNNYVEEKHAKAICSAINKMSHLEKLHITAKENEVIDLQHMMKPSVLKKLCLQGKLHKLPDWVRKHVRFVKLVLSGSKLTNESDTLGPLKKLPSLFALSIIDDAYVGNSLDFKDGDFKKLKKLELGSLHSLSSITVHWKALPSLKKLHLRDIPQLKKVSFSTQHLKNIEHLNNQNISAEGESLNFEDGYFEGLEELELGSLYSLSSITVHNKALPSLKKLRLKDIPQLKMVPFSIQHLKNLEHLNYESMSDEFELSLKQIIEHVPHVRINGVLGSSMKD